MSTPSSGGTFPFLAFPPELHNRIYRFCSPQSMRFIIEPGSCIRASDEEGDIQTIADIEHDTTTSSRQNPGPVGPATSAYTDLRSSLSQLLQTCRQIHSEAAPLLCRSNTFEIDVYIDTQWHKLNISEPYLQKEIHHVTLVILCHNPEDPKDPDTTDPMWVDLLGGLSTLEIVIQHPTSFFIKNGYLPALLNDAEWNIVLKRRLEVIKRLVSEGIEFKVDVDEDDSLNKMVEEAIPNRFTFGDLEPGYHIFQPFKSTDALDMESGDEYSDDSGEYLDFRDPDLDDPVLQELTRLTLDALPNIDPNDPDLPDMVRWIRDRRNSEELARNGSN